MNLSDKIVDLTGGDMQEIENWDSAIHTEDVQKAVQGLKEKIRLRTLAINKGRSMYFQELSSYEIIEIIDEEFGSFALVENSEVKEKKHE